jgi:hypothetical protein
VVSSVAFIMCTLISRTDVDESHLGNRQCKRSFCRMTHWTLLVNDLSSIHVVTLGTGREESFWFWRPVVLHAYKGEKETKVKLSLCSVN